MFRLANSYILQQLTFLYLVRLLCVCVCVFSSPIGVLSRDFSWILIVIWCYLDD